MRKSQIAVLSVFAGLIVVIVAMIVAARIIVAQIQSSEYAGAPPSGARDTERTAQRAAESLDLTGFERIDARGTWEITLRQGADWDVELDYSPDLEERLRVRVDGDRLVLAYERGNWSWWRDIGGNRNRVAATIVMPALEAVDVSGAAELRFTGFSGEALAITVSGAADIDGSDGRYEALDLTVSGAGDVNLGDVVVDDARLVLSGAADVMLNMNGGDLSGTISGAGKVRYRGSIDTQNVSMSGFSSIEPID